MFDIHLFFGTVPRWSEITYLPCCTKLRQRQPPKRARRHVRRLPSSHRSRESPQHSRSLCRPARRCRHYRRFLFSRLASVGSTFAVNQCVKIPYCCESWAWSICGQRVQKLPFTDRLRWAMKDFSRHSHWINRCPLTFFWTAALVPSVGDVFPISSSGKIAVFCVFRAGDR